MVRNTAASAATAASASAAQAGPAAAGVDGLASQRCCSSCCVLLSLVALLQLVSSPPRPAGVFELSDASGNPAGHIEVVLRWTSTYFPPSYFVSTSGELTGSKSEGADQAKEDQGTEKEDWAKGDPVHASTPQPKDADPQVVTDNNWSCSGSASGLQRSSSVSILSSVSIWLLSLRFLCLSPERRQS